MSVLLALVALLVAVLVLFVVGQFLGALFSPFAPAGSLFHFAGAGVFGVVGLLVGLLLGGAAIYGASLVLAKGENYRHGVVTAALGEAVIVSLGWIPLLGPPLALVGWVGVLEYRYEGDWIAAALLGIGAWLVALILTGALDVIGLGWFRAAGVPGV